jgi:hypothetical protein
MAAPATDTPAAAGAPAADQPALVRGLKMAVIGMGILILVGLGAVIWRIVELASSPKGATPTPPTPGPSSTPPPSSELPLQLPNGAAIKTMTLDGDRLAVHFEAPTGAGIAVLDLATGLVRSRIRIDQAKP